MKTHTLKPFTVLVRMAMFFLILTHTSTAETILITEATPISIGGTWGGAPVVSSIVGMQFYMGYDNISHPIQTSAGWYEKLDEEALSNSIGGTLRLTKGQTGFFDFNATNCVGFNNFVARLTNSVDEVIYWGGFGFNPDRLVTGGGGYTSLDSNIALWRSNLKRSKIDYIRLTVKLTDWGSLGGNTFQITGQATWEIYGTPAPHAAIATANPLNGFIVKINISAPGYGYTSAPAVKIDDDGPGFGAEAEAIVENGKVAAIRVTKAGSGYKNPTIKIDPPPQPFEPSRIAVGEALIANGFVVGVRLIDEGSGYLEPPTVSVVGGGGSGAIVSANVHNKKVTSFTVLNAGSGYSTMPNIIISPPPSEPELRINVSKVKVEMKLNEGKRYILECSKDTSTWTATGPEFIANQKNLAIEFDVESTGQFFRLKELR
jgi:hypothetical protein